MAIARQWLCNMFSWQPNMTTATDTHATIEELLEVVFSMKSMLRLCIRD
jgi:hypothetical protein